MQALVLLACLAAIDVEIVGPSAVSCPGDFLVLHAQQARADGDPELIFTWGVEPRHDGLVQIVPAADGRSAQVLTRPGKWKITVSAVDPTTRRGVLVSHDVAVPGIQYVPTPGPQPKPDAPVAPLPSPTPAPAPVPAPAPNPNPPPVRFAEISGQVRTWLAAVDSPDRQAEALRLADGCLAVAQRCKDGDLSKLTGLQLRIAVVSAVVQANSAAIASHQAAWQPFVKQVNDAASGYVNSGQLATAADWNQFLNAFAGGLKQ